MSQYCEVCRDTGLAHVWNPEFVAAYRREFDPDARPANQFVWAGELGKWWRAWQREGGSDSFTTIHFVVRCTCTGHRSQKFLEERRLYTAGDRKLHVPGHEPRDLGMPGCGMADYDPRIMPLKTPEAWRDLCDWYARSDAPNLSRTERELCFAGEDRR